MQVEFNLLEAEAQFGVVMDGLDVETYEVGTGTATSDYYLVLGHAGRRISGRLEYNAELFTRATAQRMSANWQVGVSLMFRSKLACTQARIVSGLYSDRLSMGCMQCSICVCRPVC